MKTKFLLTITAAFAICGAAFAQSLEQQFQEADSELNRVYKELRSQLNDEQKAELKKSQLAWIKEKDILAKRFQSKIEKYNFLIQNTNNRTLFIKKILGNEKNSLNQNISIKNDPNLDVKVQLSDTSEGFATLSKTRSLLATGSGSNIILWDIKSGYLLSQKQFPFSISGLEFDKTGESLWVFWNDDPRYGELKVTKLDPTNFRMSQINSQLDLFRPGGATCIASHESNVIVVSKPFTFSKSTEQLEDFTELTLFNFNFQERNAVLPKLARTCIKGVWTPGTFLSATVFTLFNQDGKEQYFSIEDIVKNTNPESKVGASEKIITIEEVLARRDGKTHAIASEAAKSIKEWRERSKLDGPANLFLDARNQDVSLWRVKKSNQIRKIITSSNRGSTISLKDKSPTQYPPIKDIVEDGVVFYENDLKLLDNKLFLNFKRKYWVERQKKRQLKNDLLSSHLINMNAFTIENPKHLKIEAPNKHSVLSVNEEGNVISGEGEAILKLKKPCENARAWALPVTNYFLIVRQEFKAEIGSTTIVECVDRNGSVISSTECGDFLNICYAPEIAFSPDNSAFALFGYGQKNHSAPVEYFKIEVNQSRPSIRHISTGDQLLLSDKITLEFHPYILHLKPQCVYVTRFGSNQVVSQWGNDPAPGYSSGDTVFSTDLNNNQIIVMDGEKINLLRMENTGSIQSIGTLKFDAESLTFFTSDNHFVQRGNSSKGLHFVRGFQAYPFEQFDLRLNRPDIVLERLGAPDEAIAIAKQFREKRLKRMGVTEDMLQPDFHLPEIEVVGDLPSSTAESELALKIKASDSKYPLDRLRVYVNNVPVNGKEGQLLRDAKSQTLDRTIPIKLAAGRNKIQVSVLNSAGAESLYANAEVQCTAPRPKPTLYAVAMGVSEYANPEWNLKYAAKDATDILARIHSQSGSSYGEVKELLLTDRDVTKENLTKVREFLSKVTVDDTVLMFVAGHGLLDSKYDYYFGTSDIDFENPWGKGIAFEEFDDLLAELPCLKKSLLIDTCHAGELDEDEKKALAAAQSAPNGQQVAMHPVGARGMSVKPIGGARGKSEWYDRLQGLFVDLRRGSGSTILSSSAGAEYALESSEQKNGLFTYAVLEALDGKEGSDANKDGSVSMSELAEYVKSRVATLTNNKQSPNVRRVNLEADFALTKQ
jgi:hypothetical protein